MLILLNFKKNEIFYDNNLIKNQTALKRIVCYLNVNTENENKFLESKFKFEQDIVFNPKSEVSYLYLAKIFKERENDDLQEQNLNTVILINPQNEEALYLLTLLNFKKSDYEESDKLIKKFNKVCKKICEKKSELILKLKTLETN